MRSTSLSISLLLFTSSNAFSVTERFPLSGVVSSKRTRPFSANQSRSQNFSLGASFAASGSNSNGVDFDWRQIAKDVFVSDKRPIILFDGVCNLCNGGVNFALDHDNVGESYLSEESDSVINFDQWTISYYYCTQALLR
jgi:hypothetical protein